MKKLLTAALLSASLAACTDGPTRLVAPDSARLDNGTYGTGELAPKGDAGAIFTGSGDATAADNGGAYGTGQAHTGSGVRRSAEGGARKGYEADLSDSKPASATSADLDCYAENGGAYGTGERMIVPCR